MRFSRRVMELQSSMTLSIKAKAGSEDQKKQKVINLASGDPYATTPQPIIDYAMKMASEGKTHYTPSRGLLELRELVSEKLRAENNIECTSENILITPSKTAVNLALFAIAEAGEEILVPEPFYVSYPYMAKLNGLVPVVVRLNDDFDFDFDSLERSVTEKTRGILISNPSNPTGKVYSEKTLRELYEFAEGHGLILISDDIYERFVFEGSHFSLSSIKGSDENTVTIGGFSKCFSMTGWRIGYIVGNREFISQVDKIQQHLLTCAPSVSQYAAIYGLRNRSMVNDFVKDTRKRREIVDAILKESNGITYTKPQGGFYYFPHISDSSDHASFSEGLLKEKNVSVTPGIAFGPSFKDYFRLSFVAASLDDLKTGTEYLVDYIGKSIQ